MAKKKRKGGRKAAKKKTGKKASTKPKASKRGGKRKAPKGGLDLKRIAAKWRSEGKPGSWPAYVASHKHIKTGGGGGSRASSSSSSSGKRRRSSSGGGKRGLAKYVPTSPNLFGG